MTTRRAALLCTFLALASIAEAQPSLFAPPPSTPNSCTVNCPPGRDGRDGKDGKDGKDGRDGVLPQWPKVKFPGHRVDRVIPVGVDVALTVPRETGVHDLLLYWRGVDATATAPARPGTIALVDYNQPRPCYQMLARGGEGNRIWEHLAVLTARQFHYFDVETGYWCVLEWPTTAPCTPL